MLHPVAPVDGADRSVTWHHECVRAAPPPVYAPSYVERNGYSSHWWSVGRESHDADGQAVLP